MSKKMNKLVDVMCVMFMIFSALTVVLFLCEVFTYGNYFFTTIPGYREHISDVNPILYYTLIVSITVTMVLYALLTKLAETQKRRR